MVATAPNDRIAQQVTAIRRFNRFYTRRIGVLRDGLLATPFSLTEARILYEIAHGSSARAKAPTATFLASELDLDPGYLSRLLNGLVRRGLVSRKRSPDDARQSLLALTARGSRAFATLDARSALETREMLGALASSEQTRLLAAMQTIETILRERDPSESQTAPFKIRAHRPGDWGWIVSRHGALYAEEYGWNIEFEALVAQIARDFITHFKADREGCWIAEHDGANVGAVALVAQSKTVAKLRTLIVDPSARGLGVGRALVETGERFARAAGYKKIVLWTNDVLTAARHIYESAGYRCVRSEAHHSFGVDLVGEYWEKRL